MYRVVTFLPVSLPLIALILNADQPAIPKLPSEPSADHVKPPALYVLGPTIG